MRCFRDSIICCSTSVKFYIIYRKNSLSFLNISMIGQTTLKPRTYLYELFFNFLFLDYHYLHQSFHWNNKIPSKPLLDIN